MKISGLLENRTAVMGVLNVTPDSFFDGGSYLNPDQAVERALEFKEAGADIIDVGGESTRPGAHPVSAEEEISRVIPVIKKTVSMAGLPVSCDTSKPEVAREALRAGAVMINDVTGLAEPGMRRLAASSGAAVVIMHMKGTPETMQKKPEYKELLREVREFLYERAGLCEKEGVSRENIIIDPGIGFGKTPEHNFEIISNINFFRGRYAVMAGASRKSFIGSVSESGPERRLGGSVASACWMALEGVDVLRVHDVYETVQALGVLRKIKSFRKVKE